MRNPLSNATSRPFSDATPGRPGELLLVDEHLPEYDATVARHAVVDADPETTYRAMLAVDLTDLGPAVNALGRLRDLPRAAVDRLRGRSRPAAPDGMRFADVAAAEEWTLLEEAPGEEFVVGAVGRFWQPEIAWRSVDREAFAAFDEPGYAKLALSLSVRPYGEGRTLLSYEARTATTDERARRRFRRYWRVVGPFAGYLMSRALDRAAADAEAIAEARSAAATAVGEESRRSRRAVAAAGAVGLAALYHLVVRPWHRRWGATDREATGPLPGDDLLPEATDQVTHAVEIDAPPEMAWPWLVQIGQDRGGFYSYDWLERLVGADVHNVDRVVPEHQDLAEGDVVRLAPADYPVRSPESAPEVALLDPGRALVLRPPGESPAWTWAFVLRSVDGERARLLARMRSVPARSSLGPLAGVPAVQRALSYLLREPAHFVMERKMLLGLRRRAEESVEGEVDSSVAGAVESSTEGDSKSSTEGESDPSK